MEYFKCMLGLGGGGLVSAVSVYDLVRNLLFASILAVGSTPLPKKLFLRFAESDFGRYAVPAGSFCLLLLSTAYLVANAYTPFLYFRF